MGKLALIFTLTLAAAVLSLGVVEVQAQDDESVLRELRPLAEEGDAEAQYELGRMYQLGWGVEQDGSVAEKWYLRAAEQGHDEAQFELGALYESGWLWGIPDDHEAAVEWYRRAAEGGNS
ncbi:MAG: sel1 repeat family protein, partial [Alphaproteobacteria bacterium]